MIEKDSVKKGTVWTDESFSDLGWNNTRLYGFVLPGRTHKFTLFIDYVLRDPLNDPEFGKWELVPVRLVFRDVVDLIINVELGKHTELDITGIDRANCRPTPNGKLMYWDYRIELSSGNAITFTSTSFSQTALKKPTVSEQYDLNREDLCTEGVRFI